MHLNFIFKLYKFYHISLDILGSPNGSRGKESACSAGDLGSIPGSERSLGGGHGNPLQYSCLGIPGTEEPGELQSMKPQRVVHN